MTGSGFITDGYPKVIIQSLFMVLSGFPDVSLH